MLKRSPLKRTKGLKRSRIKPISRKRADQLFAESLIRKKLIERCGAEVEFRGHLEVKFPGQTWLIPQYQAAPGTGHCEICGGIPTTPDFRLHPHEKIFRSHGGQLSLVNSKMACNKCHAAKHGIKVVELPQ